MWEEVIMAFLKVVVKKKKAGEKHCLCASNENIWGLSQS